MILYLGQIGGLTVGQDIAVGIEDSNPDAVIQKPCLISCQCGRIRKNKVPDILIADLKSGIQNIYTILLLPLILEEDEKHRKRHENRSYKQKQPGSQRYLGSGCISFHFCSKQ